MNVKRNELLKALKQCLPGIDSGKSVLEGADLFVFKKGFVHSYNDVISVAVPIKAEGFLGADIEGAVRAEEFYGIINKFAGDVISFEAHKGKWVLKSGRATAALTLMAGDFAGRFDNIAPSPEKWAALPSEFSQGLGVCRMSANKSGISGLYITAADIMSSDGYQVNHFKWAGPEGLGALWISDAAAGELLKAGALSHIQHKGTWVSFKTLDGTVFSVRTLQSEMYPFEKLANVLEAHRRMKEQLAAKFPKALVDAIDRASSFCLNIADSRAVRLLISRQGIAVTAERASGNFEETVEWEEEMPKFKALELYVDTGMILFAARRSLAFRICEKDGDLSLVFATDQSVHLMSTFAKDEAESAQPEPEKAAPGNLYDEGEEAERPAKKRGSKASPALDSAEDGADEDECDLDDADEE